MACPVLTLFSQREDRINQHTCIQRGKKLVRAAFEGEGCVFLRRSLEGLSTARVNRGLEKSEKESNFSIFKCVDPFHFFVSISEMERVEMDNIVYIRGNFRLFGY